MTEDRRTEQISNTCGNKFSCTDGSIYIYYQTYLHTCSMVITLVKDVIFCLLYICYLKFTHGTLITYELNHSLMYVLSFSRLADKFFWGLHQCGYYLLISDSSVACHECCAHTIHQCDIRKCLLVQTLNHAQSNNKVPVDYVAELELAHDELCYQLYSCASCLPPYRFNLCNMHCRVPAFYSNFQYKNRVLKAYYLDISVWRILYIV